MTDGAAHWTESRTEFAPAHRSALLCQAVARQPRNARLHLGLGDELLGATRHVEALEAFRTALALQPALAPAWSGAATCLRKLDRPAEVIALCDTGWAGNAIDRLYQRGRALIRLGRIAEGRDELHRAVRGEYPRVLALRALLESLARSGDAAGILALCGSLEPRQGALALVRGYRAAALSMTGRVEEALALVDLERSVLRYRFDPPPELGSLDAVNQRLVAAILTDAPVAPAQDDVDINHQPHLRIGAEIRALRDFIRTSLKDYLDRTEGPRRAAGMPPAPRHAWLGFGTVVLRRQGRNGQHLHPGGYLSTVYHVQAPPPGIGETNAGALVLGPCDQLTGGHRACWGSRYIAAEPGWLTIFPSHFFHDVVPTGTPEPRVTIVSDLNPNRGGLSAQANAKMEMDEDMD